MITVEEAKSRLCVALDVPSREEALVIVRDIGSLVGTFKIGMELFTSEGPDIINQVHRLGGSVFLDLKYHDIPNTVAGAARAATRMGVKLFDIHATGGRTMMEAAAHAVQDEAAKSGVHPPKLLGVTVLTSLSPQSLREELHVTVALPDQVTHLARLTQSSGLDGVVASPQEIRSIRQICGDSFVILTPGIRPRGSATNDQERITTPHDAIEMGADYIVVGRPITTSPDRLDATRKILDDMAGV